MSCHIFLQRVIFEIVNKNHWSALSNSDNAALAVVISKLRGFVAPAQTFVLFVSISQSLSRGSSLYLAFSTSLAFKPSASKPQQHIFPFLLLDLCRVMEAILSFDRPVDIDLLDKVVAAFFSGPPDLVRTVLFLLLVCT